MQHKSHVKPLNHRELSVFCEQVSLLLEAGVSPREAVELLKESLSHRSLKAAFSLISQELEAYPFWEALSRSSLFPDYCVQMVRVGEETGQTPEILASLAVYYRREDKLSEALVRAVAYPAFMLLLMLCVLVILLVKVLPIFHEVFSQLGGGLSGVAFGLMQAGNALSSWGAVVLAAAAGLGLICLFLYRAPCCRGIRERRKSRPLLFRKTREKRGESRLAHVLSVALHSGVSVDRGLELAEEAVENENLREKLSRCRALLDRGESFPAALEESAVLPELYTRMACAAYLSGSLETVLLTISQRCAQEAGDRLEQAVSRIEPALVGLLCLLTGGVLLSVMLPLLAMMSGL